MPWTRELPADANFTREEIEKLRSADAPDFDPHVRCGDCGTLMILRAGPYGRFYGCSSFPKCRGTLSASLLGAPLGIPADRYTRRSRHRLITVHTVIGGSPPFVGDLSQELCEELIQSALKRQPRRMQRRIRKQLDRLPVIQAPLSRWEILLLDCMFDGPAGFLADAADQM